MMKTIIFGNTWVLNNIKYEVDNMSDKIKTVWIVVPCYNEQDMLPQIYNEFADELHAMKRNGLASEDSIVLFVDDGSSDNTWSVITDITNTISDIHGMKLQKNSGQLCALMAGLMLAHSLNVDAAITIDCDGQDDIHAMSEMVRKFNEGNDIVYGVRNNRDTDTWFKRNTALAYYKIMGLFDKSFIYNHADFRLMSHKVLDYLDNHGEPKPFLRRICGSLTYYEKLPSDYVYYSRKERTAGDTHYSLLKMIKFALTGAKQRVNHEMGHASHDNQFQVETCTYQAVNHV